jgi:hypothetical protein
MTAEHVAGWCPPVWDVDLYIADREETGRTNAWSTVHEDGRYEGDTWVKDPPIGLIVLSGKRTPPHPALTRHLVAHEYGHNVEWMVNYTRGVGLHDDSLAREYAEMRGLPDSALHHGTGGRWHDSVHEILACDFRIVVCDIEPEYWPHPGIPHPDRVDELDGWWADAVNALTAAQG